MQAYCEIGLGNAWHGTFTRVRLRPVEGTETLWTVSPAVLQRVRKRLCPSDDCQCGGGMGERAGCAADWEIYWNSETEFEVRRRGSGRRLVRVAAPPAGSARWWLAIGMMVAEVD